MRLFIKSWLLCLVRIEIKFVPDNSILKFEMKDL